MDKPNKLARIVGVLDAAGAPMTVRDVTAALGLPVDRKNTAPVSGGLHRLEDLGVVERVHTYGAMQFRRVPGTTYAGKAIRAPRNRPDYRGEGLTPEARRAGATIVTALRVAKLFSAKTRPTAQRLMNEFGMSRETAFRWIKGWRFVNGEPPGRTRDLCPPKRKPPANPAASFLAPRL